MSGERHALRWAVLLLLGALTCFVAIDVTVKWWAGTISVLVTVWFRYLFQAVSMAALMVAKGTSFRSTRPGLHLVRSLLMLIVSVTGTLSVVMMPIGEFAALVMLTPLVVVLISALLFKEHVAPLRWIMLVVGFAGAVLVLNPASVSLGWYVILPLMTVLSYASYNWLTNRMARCEHPFAMHFYTGLVGALALAAALPLIWQPIGNPAHYLVFLGIGLVSTVGHFMLLMAFASASPSKLSVFLYFQIPLATLAGWLVFGHLPTPTGWAGILMIGVSGALTVWSMGRRLPR